LRCFAIGFPFGFRLFAPPRAIHDRAGDSEAVGSKHMSARIDLQLDEVCRIELDTRPYPGCGFEAGSLLGREPNSEWPMDVRFDAHSRLKLDTAPYPKSAKLRHAVIRTNFCSG
jgi:hypothetical protein